MKRSSPPKRKSWLARSRKPIAKRGKTGEKRRARYAKYLRSAAWKAKRAAAILRAEGECERCHEFVAHMERDVTFGSAVGPIRGPWRLIDGREARVHHKTYARFGGNELPEALECLCRACHERLHATTDRIFKGRIQ